LGQLPVAEILAVRKVLPVAGLQNSLWGGRRNARNYDQILAASSQSRRQREVFPKRFAQ
jgi:hypothetical protein